MKRVLWLSCGAAGLACAAGFFVWERMVSVDPFVPRSEVSFSETPSTASSVPINVAAWQLDPGTELSYRLDYRGDAQQGSERPVVVSSQVLVGTLHIGVMDRDATGYRALVWIDPQHPQDANEEATLQALAPALAAGVEAHLDRHGFRLTLSEPEGLSEKNRVFWQSVLDRLTAYVDGRQQIRSYQRAEHMGELLAAVAYLWDCSEPCGWSSDETPRLTRQITSKGTSDRTLQGHAQITFRPGFQGVSSIEIDTTESIGQGLSALQVVSKLKLQYISQAVGAVTAWRERGQPQVETRSVDGSKPSHENPIDQAVVLGLSESELLAELRQHQDLTELPQATYLRLKSWIAVHPEALPQLSEQLAGSETSESVVYGYVKALGAVGSAAAQEALVKILRSRAHDETVVERVLTGLALLKTPVESAEKALRELATAGASAIGRDKAVLVLGAIGHHLAQSADAGHKARAAALERDLGQWLKTSQDRTAREKALGALGNLGPADVSILDPYLSGEDTSLKARAYFALRFSPAPEAVDKLVEGASTQTSSVVRRDIIEALSLRPKDSRWLTAIGALPWDRLEEGERLILARSVAFAPSLDAKARKDFLLGLRVGAQDPEMQRTIDEYVRQL